MKRKSGTYDVFIQKKGKEECSGQKLKDGEVFYTVWLPDGGFDTTDQSVAEVMIRLIRIESKLKKIEKMVDNIDKC